MNKNTFLGTIIGFIFFLVSLLVTYTYIIPIASVYPAVYVELLTSSIVSNDPYSNVGRITIIILSTILIIFLLYSLLFIVKTKRKNGIVTKNTLIPLMTVLYFLIHPLIMYIHWAVNYNYKDDGQLIFIVVETFPYSSLFFLLFGILFDLAKNITKEVVE